MKRLLSIVIAFSLFFSILTPVYAIDTSGGSGSSEAVINQEFTTFSVSLPTSLPISVDSNGAVATATSAEIVNNSFGPVEVKDIQVNPQNGWSIQSWDTDFSKKKVGLSEFSLQINDTSVGTDGSLSLGNFDTIYGGDKLSLSYDGKVATQKNSISNLDIAEVVFTVGWDESYTPEEPEDLLVWDRYSLEEVVNVRGSEAETGGLLFDTYMSYPGYLNLKNNRDYLVTIDYEYGNVIETAIQKTPSSWEYGYSSLGSFYHRVAGDDYDYLDAYIYGEADGRASWLLASTQFSLAQLMLPELFDIDIDLIAAEVLYDLGLSHIDEITLSNVDDFRSRIMMHPSIQGHSEIEAIEALFHFLEGDISFEEIQKIPEFQENNLGIFFYSMLMEDVDEIVSKGESWMVVIGELSTVNNEDIENIKIEELVPSGTVSSQYKDYPENGQQDGYWYILR